MGRTHQKPKRSKSMKQRSSTSDKPKYCRCTPTCRSFIRLRQRKRHYALAPDESAIQSSQSGDYSESESSFDLVKDPDADSMDLGDLEPRNLPSESDLGSNAGKFILQSVLVCAQTEGDSFTGNDGSDLSHDGLSDSDFANDDFEADFTELAYNPDADLDHPQTTEEIMDELEAMLGPENESDLFDIRECW